jgi:pimeloyl-[acyl-carrier protein] methyl ester esterase
VTQHTITLTGWGQPFDALSSAVPRARHVEYAHIPNMPQAMAHIAHQAHAAECVVGWSMGGLFACQMIARRMISPKKLVLIGVPFQFVETSSLKLGMKKPLYDQFVDNYRRNPERTLKKAYQLIAHGDGQHLKVEAALTDAHARLASYNWLYWLEALGRVSCAELEFTHFPSTTIIHGLNDAVVNSASAEAFHARLPNSQLHLIPECGHAPHWHGFQIHLPPLAGG